MKRLLTLVILISICTSLHAQSDQEALYKELYSKSTLEQRFHLAKPYLQFTAKTVDEKEISSSDLAGKVVMLNFWFAHCPPCVAEMGELNKLYAKHKDNPDFIYISVTFEPEATIKEFINKYEIAYNIYMLSEEECGRLLATVFPTTIFLDREGIIRFIKHGGALTQELVEEQVNYFDTAIRQLLEKDI